MLRRDGLFGKTAVIDLDHHPVARLEARYPGSQRRNDACPFLARRERQIGTKLVLALNRQQVREIDRSGMNIDQNFPRPRYGRRHFFKP